MQALTHSRLRLPLLLLVAILARVAAFGNPVVHVDEAFYFATADQMWQGALPFVDIWDRKPVGLFLLYMPAAALAGTAGIWAYQVMALICVVGTAEIVARLATRAGWAAGATFAAIAYILWLDVLGGVGGQSPIFYNLLIAAAAMVIATASEARRTTGGVLAMALVGLSLQIKYSVVFEGLFFGLWLLAAEWQARRSPTRLLAYAASLIGVAILPTAAAFATYVVLGHADAFIYANFTSILARRASPWPEAVGNAAGLALMLSPLVGMAFGSRGAGVGNARIQRFLFAWFAASLAGIVLFGGWFDHYGLPAVAPGAACAAGWLGARRGKGKGRAALAVLLVVALIGQVTVILNRIGRGSPQQLAAITAAIGSGSGCLYVYSGPSMLYRTTGRCTVTRYLFPSHLGRTREQGAIGVDQAAEVGRIFAQQPEFVVMRPPYIGERPAIRGQVAAVLARGYRNVATLPLGDEQIGVYRRR
jgi:hypothetical protein